MTQFGAFDFGLRARDDFSDVTRRFRSELEQSRRAFVDFRRSIRRLSQDGANVRASLRSITDAISARRFNSAATAVERFDAALRGTFRVRTESTRLTGRQVAAERNLNQQYRDQVRLLRQVNTQLAQRNRLAGRQGRRPQPLVDPAEPARVARTQASVRGLRNEFTRTRREADRLRLPLGNVLGTVFAITAVRAFGGVFRGLVSDAVDFNRQIETSQLGIAALLTATGEVRDQFGGAADASSSLALASGVARSQIQALQQDALNTTATLAELSRAFQEALAPGLTAGLNVDQVRQFSVQISQAASALGLAQNQLAEEIRSILSGTIQARTTRIATALGITNEDIRNAREFGDLFGFLQERFSAFSVAGRESLNTFEGLRNRVNDVLQRLSGAAGADFFDTIRESLRDIFDLLTQEDEFGVISPSPQAVQVFNAIFQALRNVVQAARDAAGALNFETALGAAQGFAGAIEVVGDVLIGFGQGIAAAFNTIRNLLSPFVDTLMMLSGESTSLSELVAGFVEVGSLVATLIISFRALNGLITAFSSPIGLIALAIAGIVVATREWLSEISGTEASFADVARVIGVILAGSLRAVVAIVRAGLNGGILVALGSLRLFLPVIDLILAGFQQLLQASAAVGEVFDSDVGQRLQNATDSVTRFRSTLTGLANDDERIGRAAANATSAWEDFGTAVRETGEEFDRTVASIGSGAGGGVERAARQAASLSERFGAIPPFISTINNALADVNETLARTSQSARETSDALMFEIEAAGLTGDARQIEQFFAQAQNQADETARALNERVAVANQRILNLQEQQADQAVRFTALTSTQQAQVQGLLNTQRQLALEVGEVTTLKAREAALENQIREAAQRGDTARASALQRELAQTREILQAAELRVASQREFLDIAGQGVDPFVSDLSVDSVRTNQELNNTLEDRRIALEAIRTLEQELATIANTRAETAATRANAELNARLPLLQAEVAAEEALTAAEAQRGVAGGVEAAEAENRLRLAQAEQRARERELQLVIQIAQARIAESQARGLDTTQQEARLRGLEEEFAAEQRIGDARIDSLERARDVALQFRDANIAEGFREGLVGIAEQIGSEFQAGIDIATGIVNGFASFVSNAIVDAFDPTKEFDLQEAFARFLQDIARLVIQQLTQIAIARAILGLGIGAKTGGEVPSGDSRAQPTLAHHYAPGTKGYARGGKATPPKGVDPRDNIPIWAQAGEFMMRVAAVRKYGATTMAAINAGYADVNALRAAAGSRRPSQRMGRIGYQEGGVVPEVINAARESVASVQDAAPTASRAGGPIVAASVRDKQDLDRTLRGGQGAYDRFTRDNAARINASLGNRSRA